MPVPLQMSRVQVSLSEVHGKANGSTFTRQLLFPSQVSGLSQSVFVGSPHDVPDGSKLSGGQSGPLPGQFSGTSQSPVSPRHSVVIGSNWSGGQWELTPSQFSIMSQMPAEPRHSVPLGFTPSAGQVGFTPSHSSGSSHSWPTLAARHSVPKLPAGCVHIPPPSHSSSVQVSPSSVHWVPALSLFARHVPAPSQPSGS